MRETILIVNAPPLLLAGLRTVLSHDYNLDACGPAADPPETLQRIRERKPGLAIVDFDSNADGWTDFITEMHLQFPSLQILVLSARDEIWHARRALMAGARGYLSNRAPLEELREATRSVSRGELYASPGVISQLASQLAGGRDTDEANPLPRLTNREFEILDLTGNGLSARRIAIHLNLGKSTIESYRKRLREKLRLKSNSDLLQSAIRWKCGANLKTCACAPETETPGNAEPTFAAPPGSMVGF